LIVAYAGSLVYRCTTGGSLIPPPSVHDGKVRASYWPPIVQLGAATALITVQAEVLVGGVSPVLAKFGISELLTGVIIIALVENAAEHYSAIRWAPR
jgi:calcium/proton exchanger cax